MYRRTKAVINLQSIGHNIRQLQSLLDDENHVMGVVKADGYGHGSVEVANVLLNAGVDFLMVALLEEAIHLRKHGIVAPILVVGRVHPEDAHVAASHHITINVYEHAWVEAVKELQFESPLHIHVEFETGMNRTGICTEEELRKIVSAIHKNPQLKLTGAFTHFATADDIDSAHFHAQYENYEKMLHILASIHDEPIMTHVGNSAAGIQYPEKMKQYTRFGVSLYGLYPSAEIRQLNNVTLEQAYSLYSELIQVKKIKAGDFVGYGANFVADTDMWIGTIPIGYADGWTRKLQGFEVLIAGKRMPIVGRICMDSMMVRLDGPYEVGEQVTLLGGEDDAFIDMDEVANYLKTINYEIPCMITSRVPRQYC